MELIDLLRLLTVIGTISCVDGADTKMKVNEDDDAILSCSLGNRDISNAVFDWQKDVDHNKKEVFFYSKGSYYGQGQTGQDPQFEGRVFHFPDQLQFGNASIVIRNTKTSDSGTYTCYSIASFQKEIQSIISLTVGASPRPCITYDQTTDGALLRCRVLGASPQPVVEWWDSDGNILPADKPQITERGGNKYDVVLNVIVTESGFYRCVSTQKEINHQIYTETYAVVPEDKPSIVVPVVVAVVLTALVVGVVGVAVLRCSKSKRGGGAKLVVIAGNDVILPCSLGTEQNIEPDVFVWKKDGRQDVFLYDNGSHSNNERSGQDEQFKGRVSHFSNELINGNASIIIKKTRPSDSGLYTCTFPNLQQQTFHVELVVGGAKLVVIAGSDVILPCSLGTEQNIKPDVFVWKKDGRQDVFLYDNGRDSNNERSGQDQQFKRRVFHFPDELINGNASITIKKTRPSDSGIYTCTFPNLQQQTFRVELVVEELQKTRKHKEPDEPDEEVKLPLHESP